MRILGFNRVELLMSTEDLNEAVGKFNDLLGTSFSPPRVLWVPHHLHPEGPAELIRAAGG
jgi:hypothetical protein